MSRIMVMGPLELLMETLSFIQQLGIMQVDEEIILPAEKEGGLFIPQLPDSQSVLQHEWHEKLVKEIDRLLFLLSPPPSIPAGESPATEMEVLASLLPSHLSENEKRAEAINNLTRELAADKAYSEFLSALGNLEDRAGRIDVQCMGVKGRGEGMFKDIQQFLEHECKGRAVLETVRGADGKSEFGVIVVPREEADSLRQLLEKRRVPLLRAPSRLDDLPLSIQQKRVAESVKEKERSLAELTQQQARFAGQWYQLYLHARARIEEKLSLIKLTGAVVKTRMCFFVHGWLPAEDFALLAEELRKQFQGRVVAEESELVEQDFSRIPIALHNPAYFEPFELFSRMLPMPPYASFDITPFIGIFFPIFFGMMLGDIGYGFILLAVSVLLIRVCKARRNIRDAGKILFISSLYTIGFGWLFGECLGTAGHMYFFLEPVCFDRRSAIVPMLFFAVSVGVVHVIIGLVLGIIVSLRRHMKKEAVLKSVNIFIILCASILVVSHYTRSIEQVRKPLMVTIAIVVPALLLVGGFMAPLELLKNVGNIISYARIMAVGLTSVMLAFVANYIAGRMGSVWAGITVAVLLHVFNLLLGVFAPTIHSLRLHYVEFLSKFMEPGGKEFKPLGRKQ